MATETTGLNRDLQLIRARVWLFIPFFVFGLILAFAFSTVAGKTNAVAELELDTVIHDATFGGDRGLRVFEAQSMTEDPEFIALVLAEIDEPDFDYSDFDIELRPVSLASGISRGTLVVSIKADGKGKAEGYREAFVKVFANEFLEIDGLWRTRFISAQQDVSDDAESRFRESYRLLDAAGAERGIVVDELFRSGQNTSPLDSLNVQEAELRREIAETEGALAAITESNLSASEAAALAAAVIEQPVAPGDGEDVLAGWLSAQSSALDKTLERSREISDGSFDAEFLALLDSVRALDSVKEQSYVRLENARIAVTSSDSTLEVDRTFSGGLGGSIIGQLAVVLTVTLVFGLIAIYAWEWLSQLRSGIGDT
jgi:hypothetical protein